jgi:hypothetical protein
MQYIDRVEPITKAVLESLLPPTLGKAGSTRGLTNAAFCFHKLMDKENGMDALVQVKLALQMARDALGHPDNVAIVEKALEALASLQPAQEPLACLHLGGITDGENPEFEENDISLNTKAIEALQQRLVSWGKNHDGCNVDLYASPLPQSALSSREQIRNEALQELKDKRNQLMREAEKAAYEYFCECDVGREREKAHEIYENIRTAGRVY